MKSLITSLAFFITLINANASDITLLVKQINNNGIVPGNTYRLYAVVENPEKSVHAIFGDETNPMVIESTDGIWQSSLGGYSAGNINEALFQFDQTLAFDSWFTLGYENDNESNIWDLGMDFTTFEEGQGFTINNGALFLLPTDERCFANTDGLLLLAQFTTSGVVSGTLNLQGWEGPQNTWQIRDLHFSTADVFAENETITELQVSLEELVINEETTDQQEVDETTTGTDDFNSSSVNLLAPLPSFEMFPNPNTGEVLNISSKYLDGTPQNLSITDISGKLVYSEIIISSSSRLSIKMPEQLSPGLYNVSFAGHTEKLVIRD